MFFQVIAIYSPVLFLGLNEGVQKRQTPAPADHIYKQATNVQSSNCNSAERNSKGPYAEGGGSEMSGEFLFQKGSKIQMQDSCLLLCYS